VGDDFDLRVRTLHREVLHRKEQTLSDIAHARGPDIRALMQRYSELARAAVRLNHAMSPAAQPATREQALADALDILRTLDADD
jgi:hypothetical protein